MPVQVPVAQLNLYCQNTNGPEWDPDTPMTTQGTISINSSSDIQFNTQYGNVSGPVSLDDSGDFMLDFSPAWSGMGLNPMVNRLQGRFSSNTQGKGLGVYHNVNNDPTDANAMVWIAAPQPRFFPTQNIPVYIGANNLGSLMFDANLKVWFTPPVTTAQPNPVATMVGYIVPPADPTDGNLYGWLRPTLTVTFGGANHTYQWFTCRLTGGTIGSGKLYSNGSIVRDTHGARVKKQDDSWSSSPQIR